MCMTVYKHILTINQHLPFSSINPNNDKHRSMYFPCTNMQ